jgi:hypothetical protein
MIEKLIWDQHVLENADTDKNTGGTGQTNKGNNN